MDKIMNRIMGVVGICVAIVLVGAAFGLAGCATTKGSFYEEISTPLVLPDGTVATLPDGTTAYVQNITRMDAETKAYLWAKVNESDTGVEYEGQSGEDYFHLIFGKKSNGTSADMPTEAVSAIAEGVVNGLKP